MTRLRGPGPVTLICRAETVWRRCGGAVVISPHVWMD